MEARQTDRGIQVLRIIACFTVFLCHFCQRLYIWNISDDLYSVSQLGRFGVELFFVISGYLACFSLAKCKSVLNFYKKRAIRILVLYFVCILYFFVTETFIFHDVPKDNMGLGWLRYIFCLNGIVPSEGYFWSNLGITWTIPVFLMFYILAPLIITITKTTLSSAIVLIVSMGLAFGISKCNGWFSALTYLPCFSMGILAYNAKKENLKFITALGLLLFIFVAKFSEYTGFMYVIVQVFQLSIVSAVFAIIVLFTEEVRIKNEKAIKVLDVLDEHSYTLYLVHGITFCGILDKFGVEAFGSLVVAIIARILIAIVLTVILTIVVHRFVEKPIQNKLTKLIIK